jgi:cytochrome c-type biogenesis protein CcmH/NrfG
MAVNHLGSSRHHEPITYPPKENAMTRYYVKLSNTVRDAHHRATHVHQDPSDQGGVAAEYGVLLAGIVALVAVAALALGGRISALFDTILP